MTQAHRGWSGTLSTHVPTAPAQKWTYDETCRQLLLHNPFLGEGAALSARSDEATEDMAVRWAAHGLITVEDALTAHGDALTPPEQFGARWPALADDADSYKQLYNSVPAEWMTALRHGTTDSDLDRETWTTHDSVHYWRQWTEVTKDKGTGEEKKTRMTQAYTREADSVLLGSDSMPQPAARLRAEPRLSRAESPTQIVVETTLKGAAVRIGSGLRILCHVALVRIWG